MMTVHRFTDYFQIGGYYGLGMEVMNWFGKSKDTQLNMTGLLYGHGGGDYGSSGYGGFEMTYGFSYHFQTNSAQGMNSTLTDKENHKSKGLVCCKLYNDVLAI